MAKKIQKDDGGGGGGNEWMNTYADMVTLLFVLFVLLFSMSSINPVKWDILVQTWGNKEKNLAAVGGGAEEMEELEQDLLNFLDEILSNYLDDISEEGDPLEDGQDPQDPQQQQGQGPNYDFDYIYQMVSIYIEINGYADKIEIEKDENFVMIRFKDKAFFESGRAIISAEGREVIAFLGEAIKLVLEQVDSIKIEGHTDNVPQRPSMSSPYQDNWALSMERARQVLLFLAASGIPDDTELLMPVGLAATRPIGDNDTPEGRAENRRVEIYITRAELPDEEADAQQIIVGLPDETAAIGDD